MMMNLDPRARPRGRDDKDLAPSLILIVKKVVL